MARMALAIHPVSASANPRACRTNFRSSNAASLRNYTAHGSVKVDKNVVKLLSPGLRIRCDLDEADRKVTCNQGDAAAIRTNEKSSSTFLAQKGWRVAAASAMAALTLLHSGDVALAYKGGGPYGIGVTRGQDLSYKDFSGQDLTKQDFKTSILRQTKFTGAKLLGASFFDADLTGADFSGSDLRGADFSLASAKGADFTNANLEGALVTGNTSFKGSTITGADFTDVNFREDQRRELCQVASGVNPLTGNETRATLFCD